MSNLAGVLRELSVHVVNVQPLGDDWLVRRMLKPEITSHDAAELAAELCGSLFAKTTGVQIPLDGGDARGI